MKILITRPYHHSITTQKKLAQKNHTSIWCPLLKITPTKNAMPKKTYDAYLISSLHAVSAMQKIKTEKPIFTTGDNTASELKKAGNKNIISAKGNAIDMANKVANSLGEKKHVLYICAETTAHDMQNLLAKKNIKCENWIVYKTTQVSQFSPEVKSELLAGKIDAILLYSAQTANCFVKLFKKLAVQQKCKIPIFYALSRAILAEIPAQWQSNFRIAAEPNENSLINML